MWQAGIYKNTKVLLELLPQSSSYLNNDKEMTQYK